MSNKKVILVRADSSSTIGTGHIYRCMTLLKPLRDKYKVIFCTQALKGNINQKIVENGFNLISIIQNTPKEMKQIIKDTKAKVVVIDSYDINYKYEKKIKKSGAKIVCFDDMFFKHKCDVVLNHSIEAKKYTYKKLVPKNCKILCGSEYTLLRDEFFDIKLKNRKKLKLDGAKVLVMFGGSDPKNFTLKTLKVLNKIDVEFKTTIITTTANANLDKIKAYVKGKSSYNLVINTDKVAEYINSVDFAITTSGGTILEMIYMKVPFINIKLADNQSNIVNYFKKNKIALCLDDFDEKKLKNAIVKIEKEYKNTLNNLSKFKFEKYKVANIIDKMMKERK
jgi:UDP-2,4-diacetamido-2,4,6-trideoxy-beta-L-altropyranose hydrolase